MRKRISILMLCIFMLTCFLQPSMKILAKGTQYYVLEDVYYAKSGCLVYAEPTYNSTVLTKIEANVPVRVVGYYTNGWYRINLGVICYCKIDSLTPAGEVASNNADPMIAEAQQIAKSLGYKFQVMKLNKEKIIKKDIFNSYIDQKLILYVKCDDDLGILFKMIYDDPVKRDVNLNFTKSAYENPDGSRTIHYVPAEDTSLYGQMAIYQIQVGYDKAADLYIGDMETGGYNLMNTYFTEFGRYAYAPTTQVAAFYTIESEIMNSLNDKTRTKMNDLKRGIKYLSYDQKDYRSSITNKLRKETEYIDYNAN